MAKEVKTGLIPGIGRIETGEYTVGDITNTYAVPTTLRSIVSYSGHLTGVAACVSTGARPVTNCSICSSGGSYYLDFSIMDVSAAFAANGLVYTAIGY